MTPASHDDGTELSSVLLQGSIKYKPSVLQQGQSFDLISYLNVSLSNCSALTGNLGTHK